MSEVVFLAVTLAYVIATTISVEVKKMGFATLVLIIYFSTVMILKNKGFTDIDLWGTLVADLAKTACLLAVYLFIGLGWSVARWSMFVWSERRRYDEKVREMEALYGPMSGWEPERLRSFKLELGNSWEDGYVCVRPQIRDHKEEFFLWLVWWPFSLLWTMIDDPLRRFCVLVYNLIGRRLQAISDFAWRGTEDLDKKG